MSVVFWLFKNLGVGTALGLHCVERAFSSCAQASCCGGWASLVGAHGLSCFMASGILVPQSGIKRVSPVLQGPFLPTGPPEKSHCSHSRLPHSSWNKDLNPYPGLCIIWPLSPPLPSSSRTNRAFALLLICLKYSLPRFPSPSYLLLISHSPVRPHFRLHISITLCTFSSGDLIR